MQKIKPAIQICVNSNNWTEELQNPGGLILSSYSRSIWLCTPSIRHNRFYIRHDEENITFYFFHIYNLPIKPDQTLWIYIYNWIWILNYHYNSSGLFSDIYRIFYLYDLICIDDIYPFIYISFTYREDLMLRLDPKLRHKANAKIKISTEWFIFILKKLIII